MNKLSVKGMSISLAVTLAVVFVLCALAETVNIGFRTSHMWLNLFSASDMGSGRMWVEGTFASLAFGAVAGYLFAATYNKFAR